MKIGELDAHPQRSRHRKGLVGVIAVVVVAVVISMYTYLNYRDVRAIVVGNTVELASRSEGRIARVLVRENESFEIGAPLVELTNDSLLDDLRALEREVSEVRNSLAIERSGLGLERRAYDMESAFAEVEAKLNNARIRVESADRVLDGLREAAELAEARHANAERLMREGAMTRSEIERRRLDWLEAARAYEAQVAEREVLASEVETYNRLFSFHSSRRKSIDADRTRTIHDLELTLSEKERELSHLRNLTDELTLRAGHSGIVTAIHYEAGEFVPSGAPLMTVMSSSDIWVEAYMPASEKRSVTPGDLAVVTDLAGSARLQGKVEKVLPVLRPYPDVQSGMGVTSSETYAVLVIRFDDLVAAQYMLSPAQQVQAKVRRRWMPIAQAQETSSVEAERTTAQAR